MPPDHVPEALVALGWDDEFAARFAECGIEGGTPGRVARIDRGRATVLTADDPVRAELGADMVATGDWVVLTGDMIAAVLARRSAFKRGDTIEGVAKAEQVVAANVDVVFVVQSLTNGPNLRRLERELVLAFESGARPVVVLSKSDALSPPLVTAAVTVAHRAAPDLEVIPTSAVTKEGVDGLLEFVGGTRTVALIGASGVGKSTLVNRLAGVEVQSTGAVRESDDRGRHTTTARELILLPSGGVLIDTPGLRSVSLWDADEGFSRVFADIEELASRCKFSNCAHGTEPECAIQAAIARGELDRGRLDHYRRLDEELDAAQRLRDARA